MILIGDVNEPKRATTGSAGYDFYAPEDYELRPGEWTVIDTGVSLDDYDEVLRFDVESEVYEDGVVIDEVDYEVGRWFMMVVPRSGLSNKYGFRIRNTVGIIDMDYRDTIKVMVTVDEPYTLQKGERFIQGIVIPFGVFRCEIEPTEDRSGGHGSTGRF